MMELVYIEDVGCLRDGDGEGEGPAQAMKRCAGGKAGCTNS